MTKQPEGAASSALAVAQRLREARKAAGLTQAEVASRIGVNRRAIHEWEAGTWQPHRALPELAEVYGVSTSFLSFGVEPASVELQQLREQLAAVQAKVDQVEKVGSDLVALRNDVAAGFEEMGAALVELATKTDRTFAALRSLADARLDEPPA